MPTAVERLRPALADRYRIERELGAGGMATVYLAHDMRHDRPVALKVLRPELSAILGADRFLAEIKTTANLQHPHILPLHDSGEAAGLVYYVMPYVEGESLRDRLRREKQLPLDEAVRITREVADALDYAHRHGVIHRDIKPENILVHDAHVSVADFGIALAVSRSEGGSRMTETGMSLGTPQYMAPEQAMGDRDITSKVDIYALGAVLYEMLTGEPPFSGPTAQAIIAKVVTSSPTRPSLARHTIPPHVEAAALKALEKLPADRHASAAAFADALARPVADTVSTATPAPVAAAAPWRARFLAAAATAALLAAIGAWGWLRGGTRSGVSWQYIQFSDTLTPWPLSPALALSPDGTTLLLRDAHQNGLLWLKRRDELEPTPLAFTERALNPVFSPDGQWIAFVGDGRLKKVRSTGGPTLTLADSVAGGYGGAAWIDNETLLYVSQSLGEIRRVGAAGGTSTTVAGAIPGGGAGYPIALPGGRGAFFQACTSGCATMEIHVLDLRSGREKLLLPNVATAWLLPDGRIFYVRRDGVGVVAPFDLSKLEVSGPAVPVLENVSVGLGFAQLAWSPAGTLVYQRGGNDGRNVVTRVKRDGATTIIDTAFAGEFNSLALSPDGRQLALGVGRQTGGLSIWVKQLDRGPFTRLSFNGQDRRPAWSPDGRRVAFVRDTAGSGYVAVVPVDGSGPAQPLVRIARQIQEVAWSRDGRWVLLRTDNTTPGAGDIVAVRADGSDTSEMPGAVSETFTELHPALSPSGRWLAYSSNESGQNEIYVRPFPGPGGRWQVSNAGGVTPRWSADGREVYFVSLQGQMMAAQVREVPAFAVTRVQTLFELGDLFFDSFHQAYDVGRDGYFYFLAAQRRGNTADATLVLSNDWFEDVRARARQ